MRTSLQTLRLALFTVAALAAPTLDAHAQERTTIIVAPRAIIAPDQPPLNDVAIEVRDGRIVSVRAGAGRDVLASRPNDADVLHIEAGTLMPGLIDAHVHLSVQTGRAWWAQAVQTDEARAIIATRNARVMLMRGFTTVRDVGSPPLVGYAIRDAVRAGTVAGPRIQASGPPISTIGGHDDATGFRPEVVDALQQDNTCTGPVECAARVRAYARAGADLIKLDVTGGVLSQQARGLEQQFTDEELRAIIETAHGLGMRVAAHAHGPTGILAAVRAGVDSVEHGTFANDEGLRLMRQRGAFLVPTLMASVGVRDRLEAGQLSEEAAAKAREYLGHVGDVVRRAHRLGIPIAFGTDAGVFPHERANEEFALLVTLGGLTPAEAIATATTSAARLLGLEDQIGALRTGYAADMIVVAGDPLTDVAALQNVTLVIQGGRLMEPSR